VLARLAWFRPAASSIRACGSPAHGSPTFFTVGIQRPWLSRQASATKGSTSVSGTEYSGSAGVRIGGLGVSASADTTSSDTTVNQNTTDTSREARETLGHTTSSSQMYQLFNGYHLGTNRALFVVAPRPHTVSGSTQTEFNLIDGERRLEGIQDVFLVVHMPRSLDGFCIQAGLDTGDQAPTTVPQYLHAMMQPQNDGNWPPPDPTPPLPPPTPSTPTSPLKQLVITRRVIQSCGAFDGNGNFVLSPLSSRSGRSSPASLPFRTTQRRAGAHSQRGWLDEHPGSRGARSERRPERRQPPDPRQRIFQAATTRGHSKRRPSSVSLVASIASQAGISLRDLATAGHLDSKALEPLSKMKVSTVAELFAP
jgi:hypothetical protein